MFTKRITLFRLHGFDVRVDATWLLLAVLVTSSSSCLSMIYGRLPSEWITNGSLAKLRLKPTRSFALTVGGRQLAVKT